MKLSFSNSVFVGLAAAIAALTGCSSGATPSGQNIAFDPAPADVTGKIAMKLALGDTSVSTVAYTLLNGSTVVQSGTQSTDHGAAIDFELGGVPAGDGYTITLTANGADGGAACIGTSSTFSVAASSTVNEQVQLLCNVSTTASGNLAVVGVPTFCGAWQSVSTQGQPGTNTAPTNGSEVFADGTTVIVITAQGLGGDTANLQYDWSILSSTGGGVTLGTTSGNGTTAASQSLTCNPSTQNGGAVIQLVVTDGTDGGSADCSGNTSTVTIPVTCDAVTTLTCSGVTPDLCGTGSNAICTNLQTDPNNCGACGNACVGGCSAPEGGAPSCD